MIDELIKDAQKTLEEQKCVKNKETKNKKCNFKCCIEIGILIAGYNSLRIFLQKGVSTHDNLKIKISSCQRRT